VSVTSSSARNEDHASEPRMNETMKRIVPTIMRILPSESKPPDSVRRLKLVVREYGCAPGLGGRHRKPKAKITIAEMRITALIDSSGR
jgi:hypothetical protein